MKIDWENIPTIRTSRISLRPLDDDDIDSLYAIYSDPKVMRYWAAAPMKKPAEAKTLLLEIREDLRRRLCVQWGIARLKDNCIIGTVALFRWDFGSGNVEIGFALGSAYWGMGYMHEALQAALAYGFNEIDLRRIEADVDPRNALSIRLLERLGFKKEGHLRERWRADGEIQDSLFYGLLRREWNGLGVIYQVVKQPALTKDRDSPLRGWVAHSRLRRWAAVILGVVSQ
jgi:RimJ/RimL family protein N-acetyltransferase